MNRKTAKKLEMQRWMFKNCGRPTDSVEKKACVSLIKLSQVQAGSMVNVKMDRVNPQNVAWVLR